jgi:uncharacterized protein
LKRSRSRISPVTVFFVLLSLALGVVLYVKTRPSPPSRRPAIIPSPVLPPRPRASASPRPTLSPSAAATPRGEPSVPRIAIVIDDLGNDVPAVERIARWPYEVCGAVLPVLPASSRTARQLEESGKQVLLHLPMEPRNPRMRPGPGVVLRSQTEEQIAQTLESDLDSVPGAAGVSNHMGSAATADSRVMRAVARVLARRGLFFLDSRTTGATVAGEAAREERVPTVSRRVFLDDVATEVEVRKALDELIARARTEGFAVGLGHPYAATLAVLERELPTLSQRGVRLVPVSELAR